MAALLFSIYRTLLHPQSVKDVHGTILVMEATAPDIHIPDPVKRCHSAFKTSLNAVLQEDELCRLALLSRYGTDAQIVLTLNRDQSIDPCSRSRRWGSERASTSFSTLEEGSCLEGSRKKVEDYLIGLRPAGFHPTPVKELLRGAEAPTEALPVRKPFLWKR